MALIITIIILGAAVIIVSLVVLKSLLAPRRVASIAGLLKQNKSAAAIRAAKRILAKDSRNADARYLLGLAYLAENKPELALVEFQTVNQIGHFDGYVKEVPFRKKIAELYAKFNQPEEALKEYLLLIKKEPNNAEHHLAAAKLFEERNRSGKAIALYRKAVELDPQNAEAHMGLGLLYYRAKKTIDARAELEAALKLQPDHPESRYYMGKIQKEFKEFTAALSSFEKASRDERFRVRSLVERGSVYISMNNLDAGIAELERAIKLSNDDGANETLHARYFLAACYERQRRLDLAVEQWEKIYAKKPTFKDTAEKLGQYHELRTDDRMKDYMTSGDDEYGEICSAIATHLGLQVRDVSVHGDGCEVVAVEGQSKWRNARKMPQLLRFLRVTNPIDESSVRNLHEDMKKQNVTRGTLITSSSFSRTAVEFAETRPIHLVNREKLQDMLKQIKW